MNRLSFAAAVALTSLSLGASAHAQQATRIELGMDAGLSHISSDIPGGSTGNWIFDFPVDAFRFGFAVTPKVMLEPTIGYHLIGGDGSSSRLVFDFGLPIDLSTTPAGSQVFLRPLVGLRRFTSDNNSANQTRLGVGLGVRVPVVPKLMSRFEARYVRGLKGDAFAANDEFTVLAGLSFFPR